jgi:hypothetical protein
MDIIKYNGDFTVIRVISGAKRNWKKTNYYEGKAGTG